jgi:tetratricopeptide (TPR) repeat protein
MTTPRSERRGPGGRRREKLERGPRADGAHRDTARAALAPPPPDTAAASRAALALAVILALLAAARVSLAFVPGMAAWGFNALRFVPAIGWPLWALSALALIPPLARPVAARLAGAGDFAARRPFAAGAVLALAAAALVLALPDHLWLMGDFLLRLGCARGQIPVEIVFPQALPLDIFLHHHVAIMLSSMGVAEPSAWERTLGAIEVAALAASVVALVREMGLSGAPAAAALAAVVCTGLLGLYTGYPKGFVELTLFTVMAAWLSLRVSRDGRGAWPLAIVIAAALAAHRSALALLALPPVAGALWWRVSRARSAASRASTLVALVAPFVAAALLSPQLVASMKVTDVQHLAPAGRSPGAIAAAAFAPAHLVELLNLFGQMTPLLFAAPVLALVLGRALAPRRREWGVLLALVIPAVLLLLFIHPRQGLFRDYDVFAPSLAALALATAMLAAEVLRGAPARAWLVTPLLLATVAPALEYLLLQNRVDPGLARVEAYLTGPPRRSDTETALTWSFVAERQLALGRKDDAVASFAKAAALAPGPRILLEWAMAEEDRHDWAAAREVYRTLARRNPQFPDAWLGIATTSMNLGERAEAYRCALVARQLDPTRPEADELLRKLAQEDPALGGH